MVGTIYFGLMASVVGMTGWFHPQALGLGSGVGAGIMMASSSASLCAIYPEWTDTISAIDVYKRQDIPVEPHDQLMDMVISEHGVRRLGSR